MHASTPLPSLPLGCLPYSTLHFPTLTTLPLPYTTIASLLSTPHPSAPLSFLLLPNPLVYPTLPSHPLPSAALSYPLASSTIPYPLPILHSPTLTKATLPYPPFLQLPSPTLSYPLISSHHSLLSPNPLTWRTLPCHLPSLTPPLSPLP